MALPIRTYHFMRQQALALESRLEQLQSFSMIVPYVSAAGIPSAAQHAIDRHMQASKQDLREMLRGYQAWLAQNREGPVTPAEAQQRLAVVRMRFQRILTQFDVFADALTQRSEHKNGIWLAGLDVLAADSLRLPPERFKAPEMLTYLDRGIGAAIRRARTRLPGGGENPVALIRIPRERMVGHGIGSSLVHEVGHQSAAMIELVPSMRQALQDQQAVDPRHRHLWRYWERWASEIISDLWSVSTLGISATIGLIAVVTLPRAFIFRLKMDAPHPVPWLRVFISARLGNALYPAPQWRKLEQLWQSLYPLEGQSPAKQDIFHQLLQHCDEFVSLCLSHRIDKLDGQSLYGLLFDARRTPARLRQAYGGTAADLDQLSRLQPSLAFAVLGQAAADGRISISQETHAIQELFAIWAKRRAHALSTSPQQMSLNPTQLARPNGRQALAHGGMYG
ncbi:MAG: hypothetical protein AAGJ09_06505 [Pseudomonadota bacterium]